MGEWSSGSISVQKFHPMGTVLVDEQAEVGLLGFALAFDRLAKANTSVFNAKFPSSFQKSPARCRRTLCRSSRDQLVQAMRNSDPSENGPCSWTRFSFPLHIYLVDNRMSLPIRAQFWCSLGSNLSVPMLLHLLAECTHDRPLHLWIVRILHCLPSWNTVRFQQHSGILHPYKIYTVCLVVITFSIRSPYCCNRRSLRARSSQSKGTSVLITMARMRNSHISATAP